MKHTFFIVMTINCWNKRPRTRWDPRPAGEMLSPDTARRAAGRQRKGNSGRHQGP